MTWLASKYKVHKLHPNHIIGYFYIEEQKEKPNSKQLTDWWGINNSILDSSQRDPRILIIIHSLYLDHTQGRSGKKHFIPSQGMYCVHRSFPRAGSDFLAPQKPESRELLHNWILGRNIVSCLSRTCFTTGIAHQWTTRSVLGENAQYPLSAWKRTLFADTLKQLLTVFSKMKFCIQIKWSRLYS